MRVLELPPRNLEAGVYRGHDAISAAPQRWADSWDDFSMEPEEVIERGDEVFVMCRYRGRGRASGVPLDSIVAPTSGRSAPFSSTSTPGRRPAGGDRPAARVACWMTRVASSRGLGTPPAFRFPRACGHGLKEGSPQARDGGPGGCGPDAVPTVAPESHDVVRRRPRAGRLQPARRGLRRRARRCVPSGGRRVCTQHLRARRLWPSCVKTPIP
jgi:hypothetical protein